MKPKVKGQRSRLIADTPIQPRSGPKGLISEGVFELHTYHKQQVQVSKLAAIGMEENVDIKLAWG